MKKFIVTLLVVLLMAIAAAGGWAYYTAQKMQVSAKRLTVEMSKQQAAVMAELEVKNPFFFSLSYFKVDYALRTQEGVLLSGEMNVQGNIGGHGSEMLQLPFTIDVAQVQKLRAQIKERAVTIVVAGRLHVQYKAIKMALPFTLEKEVPQQKGQLACSIRQCRVTHLALDRIEVVVDIDIANQSAHQVNHVAATYRVAVGDTGIIDGKLALDNLPAKGVGSVAVPLVIERGKLQKVKASYAGKPVPFTITGQVEGELDGNAIAAPFTVSKEIELRERAFEIKFKKIRVQKLRLRETTLFAIIEVKNMLPVKLENVQVDGDIELGEKIEAKVVNQGFTLAPGEATAIELEIVRQRGGLIELAKLLARQKQAKGKLRMKLRGITEDKTVVSDESEHTDTVPVE